MYCGILSATRLTLLSFISVPRSFGKPKDVFSLDFEMASFFSSLCDIYLIIFFFFFFKRWSSGWYVMPIHLIWGYCLMYEVQERGKAKSEEEK